MEDKIDELKRRTSNEEEWYYLYRHIRLDKNEPFYIGVGTKKVIEGSYVRVYARALSKTGRNKIWKDISRKTDYEVEILGESNSYDIINEKEIEFIKLYGRKCKGEGSLANFKKGGSGRNYFTPDQDWKDQVSERQKGELNYWAQKVLNKITKHVHPTITDAANCYGIDGKSMSHMLKGQAANTTPLMLLSDYEQGIDRSNLFIDSRYRKVICYRTMEIFETLREAAEYYLIQPGLLHDYLKGEKCINKTSLIFLHDFKNGQNPKSIFKGRQQKQTIIDVSTNRTFECADELHKETGISLDILYKSLLGTTINKTNYIYLRDYEKGLLPQDLKIDSKKKKCIDKITKQGFDCIKDAADHLNIQEKLLARYLSGDRKNKTDIVLLKDYEAIHGKIECV